jgi:putative copper export protein
LWGFAFLANPFLFIRFKDWHGSIKTMFGMIHAPEAPIFKALLLFSSLILIGTGLVGRYLEPRFAVRLSFIIRLVAPFLILTSLTEIGFTAWRALLELSPYLYGAYMTSSRHGQWVMTRVVAVGLLWWLSSSPRVELQRFPKFKLDFWLHSAACLVVGLSLSMTTHVGASGEVLPVIGDLLHVSAMMIWVSSVACLALGQFIPKEGVFLAARVSSIAAWCVGLLTLTGVYQSLIKLWLPALLIETQYGITLTIKLLLYAVVLAFAGINRFYWMPQLERRPQLFKGFQIATRVELSLLATVLLATATLGSTAPPERDVQLIAPVRIKETQGVWTLEANAVTPAIGGLWLEFRITGKNGYKLEPDARVDMNLSMPADGMTIKQNPTRRKDGTYLLDTRLGMPGEWKILIKVPGASWRIPIRFKD